MSYGRDYRTNRESPDDARRREIIERLQAGDVDGAIDRTVAHVIDVAGREISLAEQIGTLRLLLVRVVATDAMDGDPLGTSHAVSRIVGSIVETMRAQRLVSGEQVDNIARSLDRVLEELMEDDDEQ